MMNCFILVLSAFALSSCATTKPITGPDGTEHELVTCTHIEDCYNDAAEVCGGRYKIVNTSSHTSNGPANTIQTETKLLVKCR